MIQAPKFELSDSDDYYRTFTVTMEDYKNATIPPLPTKAEEIAYLQELEQSLVHNRDVSAPGPRRKLFQSIRNFKEIETEQWRSFCYPRLGLGLFAGYIIGESMWRWRMNRVAIRGGIGISKWAAYKYYIGVPYIVYMWCSWNFKRDRRGLKMIEL